MNCKKAEQSFSAYLENELDSKTKMKLEQHLKECEPCAYEWRIFQNTLCIVKNMPVIEPSSNFDRKLQLRLISEDSHKISFNKRLFGSLRNNPAFALSGILAIVVMLFAGLYAYISSPSGVSNNNEFMVHYVMPEIHPKEQIEQWRDFNPEPKEQFSDISLPKRDLVQTSHKNFNTNYILRTVTFTSDDVNKPF
jgi:hypothetical protein